MPASSSSTAARPPFAERLEELSAFAVDLRPATGEDTLARVADGLRTPLRR